MSERALVELGDLYPGERLDKAGDALSRYRFHAASEASDPAFDEGYSFLADYFLPKNEIERRELLQAWVDQPGRELGPYLVRYRMLLATAPDGALAGARDCFAILHPRTGVCVVFQNHALVAPEHRRTGLASLLRGAAARLGRELLEEHGLDGPESELLLAVEQEYIDPDDRDSHVRLTAYGRGGYQAIDPSAVPYCQPDYRDLEALGVPAEPIPMLAVVRRVGREGRATLPWSLAEAFVVHLYRLFHTHCRAEDLRPALSRMLGALTRRGESEIPLFALPRHPDEALGLTALHKDQVPRYYRDY